MRCTFAARAATACTVSAAALALAAPRLPAGESEPPRLAVVIVVDQMRPDYLTRFDDLYRGGLRRLIDEGVVYTSAEHAHATTYTASGHATIATGRHPSGHGIVGNWWFERATHNTVYAAGDDSVQVPGDAELPGRSPRPLQASTLGDWLKEQRPGARVYSVALKDRSATLMGGHRADAAFWYDYRSGTFCTSTYYLTEYPDWLVRFNASSPADDYFASGWWPSLPDSAYARSRPDPFHGENSGKRAEFPYRSDDLFGAPGKEYYNWMRWVPFGDDLVLRMAERIVAQEGLGADETTDLLFVGCSAADGVGHTWGPFSREAEDYYLKLDGYLGRFFDTLDTRVGRGRYTVVLSSDHGVMPMPEELERTGGWGQRVSSERIDADIAGLCRDVARELGVDGDLGMDTQGGVCLDFSATDRAGIDRARVRAAVAERLRGLDYVADAFTRDELADASTPDREYLTLYRRVYHRDRGPDIFVRLIRNTIESRSGYGTTHGSPYDYDRHVPLVFMGAGIGRGHRDGRVATVDIAPTMARLIGIAAPATDGRVLEDALAGD